MATNNHVELRQQVTAAIELLEGMGYVGGDIIEGLRNVEQNLSDTVACYQYGEDELTDVASDIDVELTDGEIETLAKKLNAGNFVQREAYPAVRRAVENAVAHFKVWEQAGIGF